jgi:hypothetical protein
MLFGVMKPEAWPELAKRMTNDAAPAGHAVANAAPTKRRGRVRPLTSRRNA